MKPDAVFRIRSSFVALGVLLLAAGVCGKLGGDKLMAAAADAPGAASSSRPADDAAIRNAARAYEQACDAKNAKAVGDLFAPEGEVVQDNGNVVHGRDAIAAA